MPIAKGTQRSYLKDRLDSINRVHGTFWGSDSVKLPVPSDVAEAKKRIARDSKITDRFQQKQRKADERMKARKRKMAEECRRAIEFEDAKKALRMIDRFAKAKFVVLFLLLASLGFAHAEQKPAAPAPALTVTEQLAIHTLALVNDQIQKQFAQFTQEMNSIKEDVAKSHPGFHLDPADPLSGRLVPNETKK